MGVSNPLIENFLVGPLQMRCSVVTDVDTGDTVIIDGGDEPQRLIDWIESCSGTGPHWSTHSEDETKVIERNVVALLNTHAHFDHSGHIPTLKNHFGVDWYLHPDDTFLQTLAKRLQFDMELLFQNLQLQTMELLMTNCYRSVRWILKFFTHPAIRLVDVVFD